ncbi:RNA polymerase sigma factor [Armatimonas sp.]|uniref:RNA polymerase sigma factor n=1 Tax=Armatimonas sp. TaxID=1872638 RepID=UPI00286B16E9|nr:RNA polymerase sigma factor [Armatimonas sp.]
MRTDHNETFRQLYQDYGGNVLGFLLRLCQGNRAEAEDLAQETFIAAYEARLRYKGFGSPKAWLFGIALRRWRDSKRRRREETGTAPQEDAAPAFESGVLGAITLEAALDRLEEKERAALLLVGVQGLTYKEAAQVLEEPLGTVKWRVFEATKRMRKLLCESEGMDR